MNKETIVKQIKAHPKLYYILKCVRGINNKDFVRDVNRMNECGLILNFQDNGNLYPDKNIYYIENNSNVRGFFSLFFLAVDALSIADRYVLTPVIRFGERTLYYQGTEINGSMNPFEYYFEQVSEVGVDEIEKCTRVLYYKEGHRNSDFNVPFFVASQLVSGDNGKTDYITESARIYKKYFRYKPEVGKYLSANRDKVIGNKRVLGVHVRGTDFNNGYLNHAKAVTLEQYIQETEKAFIAGKFEKIFLATDEEKAINAFKAKFGQDVIWYNDVLRSTTGEALHFSTNARENHKYLLGLEVLRDAATLAACDGLVAGLSNVSLAVRVMKCGNDESFEYLRIIENGFNTTGKRLKQKK